MRSVSTGEAITPVAGPLADSTAGVRGLTLVYRDAADVPTSDPAAVRAVEIALLGVTEPADSRPRSPPPAGGQPRAHHPGGAPQRASSVTARGAGNGAAAGAARAGGDRRDRGRRVRLGACWSSASGRNTLYAVQAAGAAEAGAAAVVGEWDGLGLGLLAPGDSAVLPTVPLPGRAAYSPTVIRLNGELFLVRVAGVRARCGWRGAGPAGGRAARPRGRQRRSRRRRRYGRSATGHGVQ